MGCWMGFIQRRRLRLNEFEDPVVEYEGDGFCEYSIALLTLAVIVSLLVIVVLVAQEYLTKVALDGYINIDIINLINW